MSGPERSPAITTRSKTVHIETGHIITAAELAELRGESRVLAEEYAPVPKSLSRAAQRVLNRGDRYPDPAADPALTAHLAKTPEAAEGAGEGRAQGRTEGQQVSIPTPQPPTRAPTPPIGVTMYHCRATGRLLCERHRESDSGAEDLHWHVSFSTLSSGGCEVCAQAGAKHG